MLFTLTDGYTVIWVFSVACYTIALGLFYAVRPPGLPRSAIAELSTTDD